jgi:hypothetical protein
MNNPSLEHQKLVGALINYFKNNLGFKILGADYNDYPRPTEHGRHAPDIVAIDSNGLLHIAEAKANYEDIYSENASEQFIDFSNRVMSSNGLPVPFHIIVYKEDEQNLRNRLIELNLGGYIGNKIKIWTL